jgi:hypothetical protein
VIVKDMENVVMMVQESQRYVKIIPVQGLQYLLVYAVDVIGLHC